MALTVGILTGGANNHTTSAEEANAVATDFVSEGIVSTVGNTSGVAPATGGFAVNASGTPDTNVQISSGSAYVTGTPSSQNSQTFRVKNSATYTLAISSNSSGSTKYDWVYIKLDATKLNAPAVGADDVATLVTSRSSSAASDDGTPPTYGYPIAVVTVANGFSTITNGNIRDVRSQVSLNTGASNASDGWTSLSSATTLTTSSGYYDGNKQFNITSSADMTSVLSAGMRLKIVRGTTPPTQCTSLNGTTQYWSKSSPTGLGATDDITVSAWIKLTSYAQAGIVSRNNGTTDGWKFYLNSSGQLILSGARAADDLVTSSQSVPLNRWVHVAASIDSSAASGLIYMDGVLVPSTYTNNANSAFNTPTQSLLVGATNGASPTDFFPGKIAQVAIYSAIISATNIRDRAYQNMTGSETSLVSYFSFDGSGNDASSNANNLTGQASAVATSTDNPYNATEYAIITKVTASTITVFTGTDYGIPLLTLSTPYYSTQKSPFGFVADQGKWIVAATSPTQRTFTATTYSTLTDNIYVPIGAWTIGFKGMITASPASNPGSPRQSYVTLSDVALSGTSVTYDELTMVVAGKPGVAATDMTVSATARVQLSVNITSATTYTLYGRANAGAPTNNGALEGTTTPTVMKALCAYV